MQDYSVIIVEGSIAYVNPISSERDIRADTVSTIPVTDGLVQAGLYTTNYLHFSFQAYIRDFVLNVTSGVRVEP